MIGSVKDSPGQLLASVAEGTDLSGIRFRYQICPGVLLWRAQPGDAGARPERDFTTSWSPSFRGGAVCASDHAVAARESGRFGRRNPATRPARWLSRRQERALQTREGAEDQLGYVEGQNISTEFRNEFRNADGRILRDGGIVESRPYCLGIDRSQRVRNSMRSFLPDSSPLRKG